VGPFKAGQVQPTPEKLDNLKANLEREIKKYGPIF